MADFSQTVIIGRLSRDPELRYVASGKALLSLSIPVNKNRREGDEWKQETTWYSVQVWGDQAERIAAYAEKGTLVTATGRMEQQHWENDQGKQERWVLVADRVVSLERKGKSDE